ncbi:universal stress protein [Streptomyces sp. NPDC020801]|uniref:universal stress protein n=1 Tax=Streptomyces sp. NPDC020801 TaxID=3365093 RepID=UPI0037AC815A
MSSTPARPVVAGLDGRRASVAAADWAAREALLRGVPLRLVHAWEQLIVPYASLAQVAVPPDPERSAQLLARARDHLTHRHPGLEVTTDRLSGDPATALVAAAADAELLVLGSRGLGRTAGFLLGSVARTVVARAGRPVVLVRSADPGKPEDDPLTGSHEPEAPVSGAVSGAGDGDGDGDVVVGVDLDGPDEAVLAFAFDSAVRRGTGLRVVYGRGPADEPADAAGLTETDALAEPLADALRPWQEKFPGVPVTAQAAIGRPGSHLVDASADAALLVVGRAARHATIGTHIGPVTDAALRHAASPVAVVPHD